MKLLNEYLELQDKLFSYFSYRENWRVLPVDDATDYFWKIVGSERSGYVKFAKIKRQLEDGTNNYYRSEIYTESHLSKWVYRGEDYTMICVDIRTDGNQLLQIFSNELELQNGGCYE